MPFLGEIPKKDPFFVVLNLNNSIHTIKVTVHTGFLSSLFQFPGRFKPRLRFDRVYLGSPITPNVITSLPRHFGLVGLEKVTNTQSFPSDHWGLIVHYEVMYYLCLLVQSPPCFNIMDARSLQIPDSADVSYIKLNSIFR